MPGFHESASPGQLVRRGRRTGWSRAMFTTVPGHERRNANWSQVRGR